LSKLVKRNTIYSGHGLQEWKDQSLGLGDDVLSSFHDYLKRIHLHLTNSYNHGDRLYVVVSLSDEGQIDGEVISIQCYVKVISDSGKLITSQVVQEVLTPVFAINSNIMKHRIQDAWVYTKRVADYIYNESFLLLGKLNLTHLDLMFKTDISDSEPLRTIPLQE